MGLRTWFGRKVPSGDGQMDDSGMMPATALDQEADRDVMERLNDLRTSVLRDQSAYFNSVLDAVAYDLEVRALDLPKLHFYSWERVGVDRAETQRVFEAVLRHARGIVVSPGLKYPHSRPDVVAALEAASAAYLSTTLDVAERDIPMHDSITNLLFGQKIEEGWPIVEARDFAIGAAREIEAARRGEIVKSVSKPSIFDRLVPVASHTPASHPSARRGNVLSDESS